MNKTIFILLLGFIVYLFLTKRVGEGAIEEGDFVVFRGENDVIVSVPNNPELGRENQYMMVISGQYQSTPDWMLNEIPMWIKNSRYIAISPYYNDVQTGMNTALNTFTENTGKVDMGVTSLTGFSSGGARVMEYYEPHHFAKVMILDPAISETMAGGQYEGEVIFLYGSDLHDNTGAYEDEYNRISEEIIYEGGVVEDLNLDHYHFPKYGFEKFGNIL